MFPDILGGGLLLTESLFVCHSLYSEERKLLRIQAWEQRNQEICQEQKGHPENVPLFGKPYKVMIHQAYAHPGPGCRSKISNDFNN